VECCFIFLYGYHGTHRETSIGKVALLLGGTDVQSESYFIVGHSYFLRKLGCLYL
jgi:hypothetical protein